MRTRKTSAHIYNPHLGGLTLWATVMVILNGIFWGNWFVKDSILYAILGLCALIGFIIFALPVLNKQTITVRGSRITISSRLGLYLVCKMPEDLYQIIVKNGKYVSFVFKVGDRIAQVSPLAYENGDQLLEDFERAMEKGKVVAEIIVK
jgi:hypothetical protein